MKHISRAFRAIAALAVASFLLAETTPAAAAVDLADAPLFSSVTVPGNLLLALSVEFPTASTAAYPYPASGATGCGSGSLTYVCSTPTSAFAYSTSNTYAGYFDSEKCYTYNVVKVNTGTVTSPVYDYSGSYFVPNSAASSHGCTSMWSGNWLNWASMQSLDEFRWVLTGGNRVTDSSSLTLLQKTYHSGQSSSGNTAQNKSTGSSLIANAMPLGWSSLYSRTAGMGVMMLVTANGGSSTLWLNTLIPASSTYSIYTGQTVDSTTVYAFYMNVQACASAALKESNCVLYGTTYKPEGLMQSYASQLRYSAVSYLSDPGSDPTNKLRDGGVLRASMAFIGPTQPVPGSTAITNAQAEWSGSTGIMNSNPDTSDASATTTATGVTISQSGVMNYLNKFGYAGKVYKYYDPVGELYYTGIRYFRNLGPVTAYDSLSTSSTKTILLDGFPLITTWTDPILYSCQKNFILGLGDTNTNYDADLPGNASNKAGLSTYSEPSTMPTEVSSDSTVDVIKATNTIGSYEGTSNLASKNISNGTYFIGGLAYDAHTTGVRTYTDNLGNVTVATLSTYWLDVLEGQTYASQNQYYYATKYGGFSMPDGTQPLGYGTVQIDSTGKAKQLTLVNPYPSSITKANLSVCTTSTGACSTTTNDSLAIPTTGTAVNAMWHTSSDICNSGTVCAVGNTLGDYRPDNYFTANNATAMKSGLTAAFAKISSEAAAANTTAISTPTVNVTSSSAISYGATYDPSNWTGKLSASTVGFDSSGNPTISSTASSQWDGRALLTSRSLSASPRKIVTCCTSVSPPGLAFTDSALAASTTTSNYASFGAVPGVAASSQSRSNFLAYLRGDKTKELPPNGTGVYRDRAYLLGDIVNSKPVAVGAPSATYADAFNPGYSTFKTTYAARGTVVYVGSNDGMLHAFDGTTGGTNSGQEVFAYVPSFVYGNGTSSTSPSVGGTSTPITTATTGLPLLGNPTFTHHYFVDATPGQFDLNLNNTKNATSTTADWRTLLIGGLGKGGNGYYALDVTKADTYTSGGVSEASIAQTVLWEFTDPNGHMGYTYGTPSVVKTKKYGWVVVMTSGYNNDNGIGYFYFVDPRTGALLESVATSTTPPTTPINMAQHTAYVPDYTDETADAIYGVDLQGDIWRVDVTGTTGNYPAPKLIATLKDANGNAQPITTRPLIEPDTTSSARYVLVGTGRLLGNSDISSTTSNVQSFYAFIDGTVVSGGFYADSTLPTTSKTFPVTRSDLNKNTDLTQGIATATAGTIGWYYDMPVTTTTDSTGITTYIAQRVNVDPVATQGVIAWAGNLPNGSACSPAGTGSTYATAFSTGKTVLIDSTTGNYTGAVANNSGVITELSFINSGGTINLYSGDSGGGITRDQTKVITTSGPKQLNWRDVPLAN